MNHNNPRARSPLYQWPSPGTILSATATPGRHEMLELNHTVFVRGAPQFLQKLASATTTGAPHCAQKRGRSIRVSGMEGEARVAQPKRVTPAKWGLGHSLAVYPSAVVAPQIAKQKASISVFDARMMARH